MEIQTVVGTVGADNTTYYTLGYEGPISLILHTLEGDADLYISQYLQHPSYNTSEYCLHSATCGIDRIDIPSSFKRPIGVGVYGHILHPLSTYRLSVKLRDELDPTDRTDEELEAEYVEIRESINNYTQIPKGEEQSVFFSILWTFLEILLEVLFA